MLLDGRQCTSRIEACIPALRRYATALLRSREGADDLVHDCLVQALDKLDARRNDADVRAWLFSIMHNLFISQWRRSKARAAREPLDEMHAANASMYPDQENSLSWRDVVRSLNRLPVEQRTVVLLVSVGDLSYAEAASVLGIPIGTVMSRLSRGRAVARGGNTPALSACRACSYLGGALRMLQRLTPTPIHQQPRRQPQAGGHNPAPLIRAAGCPATSAARPTHTFEPGPAAAIAHKPRRLALYSGYGSVTPRAGLLVARGDVS